MQYPEVTSATVEQAWPEPGSLKSRGGHHLEPQGFKGLFVSGTAGQFPSWALESAASPRCSSRPPSALILPWRHYLGVIALFPADCG